MCDNHPVSLNSLLWRKCTDFSSARYSTSVITFLVKTNKRELYRVHTYAPVPGGLLQRPPQRQLLIPGQGHQQRQFERLVWLASGYYNRQTFPQMIMDLFSLKEGKETRRQCHLWGANLSSVWIFCFYQVSCGWLALHGKGEILYVNPLLFTLHFSTKWACFSL